MTASDCIMEHMRTTRILVRQLLEENQKLKTRVAELEAYIAERMDTGE